MVVGMLSNFQKFATVLPLIQKACMQVKLELTAQEDGGNAAILTALDGLVTELQDGVALFEAVHIHTEVPGLYVMHASSEVSRCSVRSSCKADQKLAQREIRYHS